MSRENHLRVPPQSLDSEKAVLGSIMLRPGGLMDIDDKLIPEAFYSDKNRKIFEVMLELSSRNEPIDIISLSHVLAEKKILDSVGGSVYLTELTNFVPSSTNINYYADIVRQKYILRRLIQSADKLSELGYDGGTTPLEDILDTAEKEIFGIADGLQKTKYIALKDALDEAWARFDKLNNQKGTLRGISTGYDSLDNMLSGFQKADLIILAARPSVGKTALALDMARLSATKHGTPVAVFSLEMSHQQLVDRMFASQSRIDAWKLRTGNNGRSFSESDYSNLQLALQNLSKAPIFIDDQSSSSIVHIRSTARRMKAEHNIQLIIVDYLQLMTTTKNYDSVVNQVSEISRSLKSLARELDVPVLALSQLSRASAQTGEEPKLHHLRDSGAIEQDADIVMFIHREEEKDEQGLTRRSADAKIIIAKHRNGPVGTIRLNYDADKTTFLEYEKNGLDSFMSAKDDDFSEVNF